MRSLLLFWACAPAGFLIALRGGIRYNEEKRNIKE